MSFGPQTTPDRLMRTAPPARGGHAAQSGIVAELIASIDRAQADFRKDRESCRPWVLGAPSPNYGPPSTSSSMSRPISFPCRRPGPPLSIVTKPSGYGRAADLTSPDADDQEDRAFALQQRDIAQARLALLGATSNLAAVKPLTSSERAEPILTSSATELGKQEAAHALLIKMGVFPASWATTSPTVESRLAEIDHIFQTGWMNSSSDSKVSTGAGKLEDTSGSESAATLIHDLRMRWRNSLPDTEDSEDEEESDVETELASIFDPDFHFPVSADDRRGKVQSPPASPRELRYDPLS